MGKQAEKTWSLNLNRRQLEHLRDLMGIVLPHDYARRLSLELAVNEKRLDDEAQLWTRLCEVCDSADVSIGSDAPDFTITTASVPRLEVSRVTLSSSSGRHVEDAAADDAGNVEDDDEDDD